MPNRPLTCDCHVIVIVLSASAIVSADASVAAAKHPLTGRPALHAVRPLLSAPSSDCQMAHLDGNPFSFIPPLAECCCLQVTTPVLKFMAEFVVNKTQRLTFDSSSPNGILLFREVSKLVVSYGTRILLLPAPSDPYATKYKGIWISLTILKAGERPGRVGGPPFSWKGSAQKLGTRN